MREVELKAVVDDLAARRRQLEKAGGKLTFDGGDRSLFRFSGPGTNNALYVDYIEMLNGATNFNSLFTNAPNLTIYFANANVPVSKLDGAAAGRFRWVQSFTGPLRSPPRAPPTARANGIVKYPEPAPMSATVCPAAMWRAATTSAGFCHAARAGSSNISTKRSVSLNVWPTCIPLCPEGALAGA